MTHPWLDDLNVPSASRSNSSSQCILQFPSASALSHGGGNVFRLLALREITPRARHSKRLWGEDSKRSANCFGPRCESTDARHGLISWVEAESLRHVSARYSPLVPPPRSTIAAAFSVDGKTLASTHGDHTVKIIDCRTGKCLKVLSGHRRTPWVVRFHPVHPQILASGSLDQEVRLWDANTAESIGSCEFYRPIASIAFHAQGELLAVASGHKLFIWHYNKRGETPSPTIVLKTRRSLRAVHFHPHGAPFLLTAEVNDLDSPDCPMSIATSPGYLQYPPPAVFLANDRTCGHPGLEAKVPFTPFPLLLWPAFIKHGHIQHGSRAIGTIINHQGAESSASAQPQTHSNRQSQDCYSVAPMEMSPVPLSCPNLAKQEMAADISPCEVENATSDSLMATMQTAKGHSMGQVQQSSPSNADKSNDVKNTLPPIFQSNGITPQTPRRSIEDTSRIRLLHLAGNTDLQTLLRTVDTGQLHQFSSFGDPGWWELPFLQGWLMGQTHASLQPSLQRNGAVQENSFETQGNGSDALASDLPASGLPEVPSASSATATNFGQSRVIGRSGSRHRSRSHFTAAVAAGDGAAPINITNIESDLQPGVHRIEGELATSLAAAAAAELPCTVKLRIWPHNVQDPCSPLDADKCCLTVPHAVLCSEMGTHFSPCGRFLAACVACVLPHVEADPGLQSQMQQDVTGFATSPTRHPISAHQVMYELRIYSLEKTTFGLVLASRAIRAAHCLTSIQFSPTSEHMLLAYGRRHNSLLRSIVLDRETTIPIYTILEVYRVSDMELVRVLPSAEDEVNVACFHPSVGGGLVYGTKEGKLRILQYDASHGTNSTGQNVFLEENMLEVQTYALEC